MRDRYGGRRASPPSNSDQQNTTYRDNAYGNSYPARQGLYHPPPQSYNLHPPLPSGPPPSAHPSQMYQFGQQQRNGSENSRAQQFNFQSSNQLPSYPDYAPQANRYRDTRDAHQRRDYDRRDRDRDRPQFQRRVRMAADRPLLHARRETTPDQFDGMQHDNDDNPKYRNVETMSDSDSEDMEESESESEEVTRRKSIRLEGKSLPKWSNPEPYTSLPPPEASKKRKDVVKLIRKARIAASKEQDSMKQLAQNDDFISFKAETEDSEALNDSLLEPNVSRRTRHSVADQERVTDELQQATRVEDSQPMINSIAGKLASHKRKRSIDDLGHNNEVLVAPKRLKGNKMTQPTGEILPEWIASHADSSTPWVEPHQWTENAGFRLHKEICDFYEYVRPREFEQTMRLDLLSRIRTSIKKIHPHCEIHAFGSFAAGLYLPDADIDLVLVSRDFATQGIPRVNASQVLFKLSDHLVREGLALRGSVEVITKAKVPLVKFKEDLTGIRVDISFENLTGPRANATFLGWKTAYPAMPTLVTVIKQFLLMRGLNEVVNGGIGGFSVTCLVTALLQNMPRVQSGELIPEHNLGEILLEFLDLYGNQFDLYCTAIELNPPRFVDKADATNMTLEKREDRLHIVDPNDKTNDISGGSRRASFIFKMFAYAHSETLRAMRDRSTISLLEWMLGGNYQIYADQREYLRRLYKTGTRETFDISNEERTLNDLLQQTPNFHRLATATADKLARQNAGTTEKKEITIPVKGTTDSAAAVARDYTSASKIPIQKVDTGKQDQDVARPKEWFAYDNPNINNLSGSNTVPMSTQAMNKIRKKQDGNTDTSDGTAINNMGILVSNFATPEQVYRHFSAHHQSHILAITSTGLIRDKMSVFMVVFNSIASAKGAFGSINSEAHKFRRCYTDLDLAIHAHISNDECQVPKSDAIQSRPLNTRKRKAETLSNSYLTEAAVEIVEADGFVSPLSKRQRRESAPSPVSLPSKDIPSDSANDLTQVKSDALKGLCKVVAEKLTPYTLSRVRHDLASSNASEAALTLSRQQVDVIRSLCKLALRPNSAKQGAPPATLTSVPKMFANQIPLGPKKPWKTEKEEARIQKIKPQERSQELCTEFPEYASSIPNELGTKRATLLKSILRLLVLHPSTQLPQLKTTSKMQEFLKNLSAKRVQNLGIVDINRKPETRESILEQLRKTYPEFARHVPDSISKGQASEMERIFILLRQCPKPLMPERFDQDTEKKLREAVNQTRLQRLVKNKRNKKSKSPHIKKEPVDVSSTPHKLQAVLPGPPFRAHGFAQ